MIPILIRKVKNSGSKDGNGSDVGGDEILEEEAVLSTSENDSVNENGSGDDEGEEENVETEGVVAEEEESLADDLVRDRAKVPREKCVAKKGHKVFFFIYSSRCSRDCKKT